MKSDFKFKSNPIRRGLPKLSRQHSQNGGQLSKSKKNIINMTKEKLLQKYSELYRTKGTLFLSVINHFYAIKI